MEPIQTECRPNNPFSTLYKTCVVRPEIFQHMEPDNQALHESNEFAPSVPFEGDTGAPSERKRVASRGWPPGHPARSGSHPLDFLGMHTDEKVCPHTVEEKALMRQDSELIVKNRSLRHLFLGGTVDGLLCESEMVNGAYLNACIAERNYVEERAEKLKLSRSDEVAFETWDLVESFMPMAKFTELAKSRVKEFRALQDRDFNIRTLKLLTEGALAQDDPNVDLLKRSDRLFKECYNDIRSLKLVEGILFRIAFPKRGESFRPLVVLNENDILRIAIRTHAVGGHRGALLLITELGRIYYNPMLAQVCRDAISRCPTCSARQSRRGVDIAQLPNFDEVTGPNGGYAQTWVLDCKGPLKAPNGHKRYVL
jgi:hypothetical protein